MTAQIVELAARVLRAESCRRGRPGRAAARRAASGRAPAARLPRATSSSRDRGHPTPWRCASLTCSPAAARPHSSCTPVTASTGPPARVRAGDVWVGLSKGGETTEVCFLAGIARKRGARVIAITEKPDSTLGRPGGRRPRDPRARGRGPVRHDRDGQLALQRGLLRRHLRGAPGAARLHEGRLRRDAPRRRRGPAHLRGDAA